jgi:hypothetical protein
MLIILESHSICFGKRQKIVNGWATGKTVCADIFRKNLHEPQKLHPMRTDLGARECGFGMLNASTVLRGSFARQARQIWLAVA